ncbi:hypothetical protein L1049_022714 [Liquidambar formosana]|uniref:AAA+ ATPase domain-containing protein n=1 Tax=Liquidambar formosana TaxID=63359 RepID=A0AAP0RCZ2_LIQFO
MLSAAFWFLCGVFCLILWKIVENFVNYMVEKVRENLVEVIWEQVGYVTDHDGNIETLRTEVKKLGVIRKEVEHSVDEAHNNGQRIGDGADRWLKALDWINEDVKRLEDEATVTKWWFKGWCPNLISRYSLSREAKKKTHDVIGLQRDNTIGLIFSDFESRIKIVDEIMAALKDDKINAIGICGLGGVGKTTTAEKVRKRAKTEKVFDETVMTVVTQNPDPKKIQAEIAQQLGVKFDKDDFSERAFELRKELMDCKRRLVILDDVWARLDLKAIGIPFGGTVSMGCKVMLTSRNQDVCRGMKTFTIGVLSKPESWNLFKEKAGNSIEDSPNLRKIANKVVKECGGLPIAIITVGAALNGKEVGIWEDALLQLKMHIPENISGLTQGVYRSIELSYNFLESQEAKSCLLLCCLSEEDTDIEFEDLFKYGMGLGLFKGVDTLAEARKRVRTLVDKLKGFYLLLDSEWKECVKVHDVVRDVIKFKAKEGKEAFMFGDGQQLKEWATKGTNRRYSSLSLISNLNKISEHPERLACPKFDLLQLEGMDYPPGEVDDLSEGMRELKVLGMLKMSIPSSLTSISFLTDLRTLCLHDCNLKNISLIGELKTLTILSFRDSSIKELPQQIGNLTHLRLLDLTRCALLKKISSGVISSLIQLEELYLRNSGLWWAVGEEGRKENEVNLKELGSLRNLLALKTCLPTANFPGSNFLFQNLLSFRIHINTGDDLKWEPEDEFLKNEVHLNLDDTGIPTDSGINELLTKTDALCLKLKGVKKVFNDPSLVQLKTLKIYSCEGAEYLFDTVNLDLQSICPILKLLEIRDVDNLKMICHGQLPAGSFGELQYLALQNLPELMHLWKGPHQLVSLGNLRSIAVNRCNRLENLFSQSIVEGLVQLQFLTIKSCEMMEEIVATEGGEHGEATNKIRFPKLSELRLGELPSLICFCKKVVEIEFTQLSNLYLNDLPKLRTLFPNNLASKSKHDAATQYLFDKKVSSPAVSLCELRKMHVRKCSKLSIVVPSDSLQGFGNLEELTVQDCDSLVQVFEVEGLKVEERDIELLSKLKHLVLEDLHELKHILTREPKGILFFQNLRVLRVQNCKSLRNLFSTSTAKSVEQLQELVIINCEMMEEIVIKGENDEEYKTDKITIPQLKSLRLSHLPNLTCFYQGLYAFELPSLEHVTIRGCHKMKTFSFGFLSTPKLEKVVGLVSLLRTGDLNNATKAFAKEALELRELRNWETIAFYDDGNDI